MKKTIADFTKEVESSPTYVNEGLIRTEEIETAVTHLSWSISGRSCIAERFKDYIVVKFSKRYLEDKTKTPNIREDFLWTTKVCNRLGYFPAQMLLFSNYLRPEKYDENKLENQFKKNGNDLSVVHYYPKFPSNLEPETIPDKLYHVSDENVAEKIMQKGLSPRTAKKIETHPERVYFCKDMECVTALLNNKLFKGNPVPDRYDKKQFVVFEVDSKLAKLHTKFYPDLSHKEALFIYDNIHPKYLKIIDKIQKD